VSSSLVLGTTNRFRIISKPVLFFLIVRLLPLADLFERETAQASAGKGFRKGKVINAACGHEKAAAGFDTTTVG
jgi:hypothetical protein